MRQAVLAVLLLVGASGITTAAGARELHWRDLTVRAELQNDGVLRVSERHAMVFTGDWNGGERAFRVERHQTLTIHGVSRIAADGTEHRLTEGDLGAVDHYQQMEGNTLRWRARAPGDPEFNATQLIYVIDYSLANVLVPKGLPGGKNYELEHDFAFSDREGIIKRFSLDLELASNWSSPAGRRIRQTAAQLLPGEGHVVKMPVKFLGTSAPSSMSYARAVAIWVRPWILPVALLIPLLGFLRNAWADRREVTIDEGPIDPAWLERNLLWHTPEVAGAFLHGDVGPAEVSALLARMEQEGKIKTSLKTGKGGKQNMHLNLTVPKGQLRGAEQLIASAIFRNKTATNTEDLRSAYRKRGFDPPGVIRHSVLTAAMVVAPIEAAKKRMLPGILLAVAGVIVLILASLQEPQSLVLLFVMLFGTVPLAAIGMPAAQKWRKSHSNLALVWIAIVALLAIFIGRTTSRGSTLLATLALTLSWLGLYLMILAEAGKRLDPATAEIRKTLQRARDFFRDELRKPKPAIRDEWTPWLIALGLNRSIASWWKAHGGEAVESSSDFSSSSSSSSFGSSSSSPSSSTTASSFSGGGGGFGGAGASGSWGTAAMALATPISAPATSGGSGGGGSSSSSSSSSGSSSSSSGGGGGGGW